jgi:hypothetical protein
MHIFCGAVGSMRLHWCGKRRTDDEVIFAYNGRKYWEMALVLSQIICHSQFFDQLGEGNFIFATSQWFLHIHTWSG